MTTRRAGHTVLATADSELFTSLRRRPTSRAERYALGRALRRDVPAPQPGRVDAAARPARPGRAGRSSPTGAGWPELIPIRVARMVGLAVRVPARHRHRDGRGRRRPCRPPASPR